MDDLAIVEKFFERAADAIEALAQKYGGYCYRIAFNILSVHEESEECVDDTYMRVWNTVPPLRPDRLGGFVGKITRNLAIDRVRRLGCKKRGSGQYDAVYSELSELIPSDENVEKTIETKILSDAVNRFAGSLDEESRTVFVCRYFSFMEIGEVAEKIGSDRNRVNYILRKTGKALRKFLEKEELL